MIVYHLWSLLATLMTHFDWPSLSETHHRGCSVIPGWNRQFLRRRRHAHEVESWAHGLSWQGRTERVCCNHCGKSRVGWNKCEMRTCKRKSKANIWVDASHAKTNKKYKKPCEALPIIQTNVYSTPRWLLPKYPIMTSIYANAQHYTIITPPKNITEIQRTQFDLQNQSTSGPLAWCAEFSLPEAASASQPHTRNGRRMANSDCGIDTTGQRVSSKSLKLSRRKIDAGMVPMPCPSILMCCNFPSEPREDGKVVRVCLLRLQKLGTSSRTRWLSDPKEAGSSDMPVSLAMKCLSVSLKRSGSPIASSIWQSWLRGGDVDARDWCVLKITETS